MASLEVDLGKPDRMEVSSRGEISTRKRAMIAVVAFGALFCIVQYAWRSSFWHDEAFIVLNVVDKTASQLLGPLDYQQAAPPLFLLALRGCYVMLGGSEFALRLVPLICGLATLPVFAFLAWRTLGGWQAVWAVALVALANELIFQSATVKQYSGDVLVACMLLALALATNRPRDPTHRFLLICLVAAGAVWLSHPTVFIFGAISLATVPDVWCRGWRGRLAFSLGNLLVAGSFILLYVYSIRVQHDPMLFQYWTEKRSFPDYARPWMLPIWVVDQLIQLCNYPFSPMGGIVLLLGALGAVGFWKEQRWCMLMVAVGPISLTLLAACVRQFPFGGSRVTLFLTPGLVLLVARGIGMIPWVKSNVPGKKWPDWLWLAPVVLAGWCLAVASYHVIIPRTKSHIRPVVAYVRSHRQENETLYVLGESRDHEFYCYWRHPGGTVRTEFDPATRPRGQRFWIVTGFNPKKGIGQDVEPHLQRARSTAKEIDRYVGVGGAAFHFE